VFAKKIEDEARIVRGKRLKPRHGPQLSGLTGLAGWIIEPANGCRDPDSGSVFVGSDDMSIKFKGSLEDLIALLEAAGVNGDWSNAAGRHGFRTKDGGVLNYWPSKGTIQLQGKEEAKALLTAVVSNQVATTPPPAIVKTQIVKQIFIVHGHDQGARDQLELALRRLGLEPFVLMNTTGEGKTIIEALEGRIGRDHSSDFGIVLMTPDDIGYAKRDGSEQAAPRARQNVVLETGMLLSSLTRRRMIIIVKGHLEIPSDLEGIIRFIYNDHVKEIIPRLCQRLKEAGFQLDSGQIASAAQ
jgi:predicted nucleotide-binding protein